jgi:hypothetical protein
MAPDKRLLLAGLQQLNQKYAGPSTGVERVTVQMINGKPTYIMQGPTQNPPRGLPGVIALTPKMEIPIIWAYRRFPLGANPVPTPKNSDLNKEMWYGYSPAPRRDTVTVFKPSTDRIATQAAIPQAVASDLQVAVDTTGPLGWWDLAQDLEGCLCCSYYFRPVTVLTFVVPQDRVLYIDGWSFFVYCNVPVGWQFNVRITRDGDTLVDYNEVVVDPLNPDPAKRCLFSGSIEQVMNSYLRIDRGQTLNVVITPKGLAPFLSTPLDSVCGNICVLLHGHSTALLDNRDGAPRPKDVGRMRDDVTGCGLLDQVTKEDVDQLEMWVNAATAEVTEVPMDANNQVAGNLTPDVSSVSPPAVAPAKVDDHEQQLATDQTAANKSLTTAIITAAAIATALGENEGSSVSQDPLA